MLKPHKYLEFDSSVLYVSSLVLSILLKERLVEYDSLLKKVLNLSRKDISINFIPALNLLFLLGKISYLKKIDAIEFVSI